MIFVRRRGNGDRRVGCFPGGCIGMLAFSVAASVLLTILLNFLVNH